MRYFIDRLKYAIWAWRKADGIQAALAQLRNGPPSELMDGYLGDEPTIRDDCETCDGTRGIRGNENIIGGKVICDYCHADTIVDAQP